MKLKPILSAIVAFLITGESIRQACKAREELREYKNAQERGAAGVNRRINEETNRCVRWRTLRAERERLMEKERSGEELTTDEHYKIGYYVNGNGCRFFYDD